MSIPISTARALTRHGGDLGPGEPLYQSPRLDVAALARTGWWELRDDGTAYDWVPGSDQPSPWMR